MSEQTQMRTTKEARGRVAHKPKVNNQFVAQRRMKPNVNI